MSAVIRLVEKGTDINRGNYGWTPLERAASDGNLEIVEYLFSKNAREPQRAFEMALRYKRTEVVKFFINTGSVDVNQSALSFHPYLSDTEVPFEDRIRFVKEITNGKLNSPNLLILVQAENYRETIDFFSIEITDKVDTLGRTILHRAAMSFNVELINFLLENDFDVDAVDYSNHTALFYCITSFGPRINWETPVIEDENTAKINYISSMPYYSNAIDLRLREAVIGNALLNAGINVNMQNSSGWTVLHFSSASYPAGPHETLLEYGANPEIKTNFGRTADDIKALAP